jgi:hypothetical protein
VYEALARDARGDRDQVLGELRRRLNPETTVDPSLGSAGVLRVPEPLASVLPRHGLARGSVASLLGSGATSLLFTLMSGEPTAWSAIVGMPDIGLLAATEFGIDLDRVVLVPNPGPEVLQVVSILIDGVDVLVVALPPAARPSPSRLRVLTGRLRQRGAVVLSMGSWPGADLVLHSRWAGVTGVGRGHGRLRDRSLVVDVGGKGAAGRGRQATLLLRGNRGAVEVRDGVVAQAPADVPVVPAIARVG